MMISTRVCFWPLIVGGALLLAASLGCLAFVLEHDSGQVVDDDLLYAKPSVTVAEMLDARGYIAQEFKFTTRDGYILSITRGTNPLIHKGKHGLDHKLPILFLHGATIPSTTFVLNSAGIRPKVYDTKGINMQRLTTDKLSKMLEGEASVKSLPFLAMNFGYEVWILDRRGFQGSRGKVGHENRTLTDALRSLPTSLLGNALDGFSLDAGLEHHRPLRRDEGIGATMRQLRLEGAALKADNATGSGTSSEASKQVKSNSESKPGGAGAGKTASSQRSSSNPKRIDFLQALFSVAKLNQGHKQSKENLTRSFIETFDPGYWRFSLDEQAEFDFPGAIDFVLQKTGKKKLHTVGMSCGGAVILLALAEQPDLADKIAKAILWAPSVNMGSKTDIVHLLSHSIPLIQGYVGPVPFPFMMPMLEKILMILCSPEFMQRTICEAAIGAIMGFSGGQAPMRLFMTGNIVRPTSIFEMIQLGQFARTETPCKLQLNSKQENIKKYGQEKAPCYDLGQIKLRDISFYVGTTDTLVSPDAIRTTIRQMKVPCQLNLIDKKGIFFNHMGFFLHKKLDKLAILPTLLDIERGVAGHKSAAVGASVKSQLKAASLKANSKIAALKKAAAKMAATAHQEQAVGAGSEEASPDEIDSNAVNTVESEVGPEAELQAVYGSPAADTDNKIEHGPY